MSDRALYVLKGESPLIGLLDDDEKFSIFVSNRFNFETTPSDPVQEMWIEELLTERGREQVLKLTNSFLQTCWEY